METKKNKLLENEEKEDDDLLFKKSLLLPDLKNLSQIQKMRTKIKFQEILLQKNFKFTTTNTNHKSNNSGQQL